VEGSDEVFAFGEVYSGFSAYGAIDEGDDGGGDLDEGDAAVEDGGYESCQVADYSAAESDDEGFSVVTGCGHFAAEGLGLGERF